jgi:hypothetical protein
MSTPQNFQTNIKAFGFLEQKSISSVVSATPNIRSEIITPRDQYLIIVSSSVSSVLSDHKITEIVRKSDTSAEASKKIVEAATSKGSRNNNGCSAIVVKLCWYLDSKPYDKRSMTYPVNNNKQLVRTGTDVGELSPGLEDDEDEEDEEEMIEEFIDLSLEEESEAPASVQTLPSSSSYSTAKWTAASSNKGLPKISLLNYSRNQRSETTSEEKKYGTF